MKETKRFILLVFFYRNIFIAMKKLIYIVLLTAFAAVMTGCNADKPVSVNTPYPLTNDVLHSDGTKVNAPTW